MMATGVGSVVGLQAPRAHEGDIFARSMSTSEAARGTAPAPVRSSHGGSWRVIPQLVMPCQMRSRRVNRNARARIEPALCSGDDTDEERDRERTRGGGLNPATVEMDSNVAAIGLGAWHVPRNTLSR